MDVKFPEDNHWGMTDEQKTTLQIRVAERMELLGLDQSETARRARLGISFVRDILRGKSKNPAGANLSKLARALQTTTAYLMGESQSAAVPQPAILPIEGLEVVSEVQAGNWLEVTMLDEFEHEHIPVAHDRRFPRAKQYALLVRGDSMDQHYSDGTYVTCVDFGDTGIPIRDGLHVHVERRRAGGQLVEITVKAVKTIDGIPPLGERLDMVHANPHWRAGSGDVIPTGAAALAPCAVLFQHLHSQAPPLPRQVERLAVCLRPTGGYR